MFVILPFALFGEDSVITCHDYLDSVLPYYKMYYDNNLFFKFDASTKAFEDMSTLNFSHINFSLTSLLNSYFSQFVAFTITNCLSILVGFLSMSLLLKKLGIKNDSVLWFVSLMYACLPTVPYWSIGLSSLPLIIIVFINLSYSQSGFSWKCVLLFFFPFISVFASVGVFVLGLWIFGTIAAWVKQNKLNINLVAGFIALCLGYVIVDLRLFYMMFAVQEPLNRSVFSYSNKFSIVFHEYIVNGHYHATTMQNLIILPTAFLMFSYFAFIILLNIMNSTGNFKKRIKTVTEKTDSKVKLLIVLCITVVLFSAIATLHDSRILAPFIKQFIPLLDGFDWGRIYTFNRVIWYVIFALCLNIITQIKGLEFDFDKNGAWATRLSVNIFIVYTLLFGQIAFVLLCPVMYNDQFKTWFNEMFVKTGVAKNYEKEDFNDFISYREFFSEGLFRKIKEDISYNDEKVVAFGYHPSVLMYNGFNCIDGYNSVYPLSYMKKFRSLIAPELAINKQAQKYYDSWGGRMYLYNEGPNVRLNFDPTRKKNLPPAKLNIDMNVFKNDFNGKYILSRVEISNAPELGLLLVNVYNEEQSIYRIYLYRA